jgi:hypothetical protein
VKVKKTLFLFSLVFLALFFSFAAAGGGWHPQDPLPENAQVEQPEDEAETIFPGPENIKQKTALYIFIGWLWLSIGVCIFFLRQKIKEADRLLFLDFFSDNDH